MPGGQLTEADPRPPGGRYRCGGGPQASCAWRPLALASRSLAPERPHLRGRGRDPFEVVSLAVEAVAVLEPDHMTGRLGAGQRFQDELRHKTSLSVSTFVAQRDDAVPVGVDDGGNFEPSRRLRRVLRHGIR